MTSKYPGQKFLCLLILGLLWSLAFFGGGTEIFDTINEVRQRNALPQLEMDMRLTSLAKQRSADMVARGYFSHTTPEGTMVFDMLDAQGIPSPHAGEILARTNGSAQLVVGAFLDSPSHRKVILNPHYTAIGVGEAIDSEGVRHITVIFIGSAYDIQIRRGLTC